MDETEKMASRNRLIFFFYGVLCLFVGVTATFVKYYFELVSYPDKIIDLHFVLTSIEAGSYCGVFFLLASINPKSRLGRILNVGN